MRSSQISSAASTGSTQQQKSSIETESNQQNGYQWTALSVTTVGALLASIQGSALLIALPNILTELQATFFTIMQVFIYGGGMSQFPTALALFLGGLHLAFFVSFGLSVVAMIVAALRPAH